MKSLVVNHLLISMLLGMGAAYGLAHLAFGSTGAFVLAIIFAVGSFAWFVYSMEKFGADLRKDRRTGRKPLE